MDRDANSSSLRNILAATVVGVALAGGGYLAGRDSAEPPIPAQRPVAPEARPVAPPAVVPETSLERADLLRLAAAAADAFAGGPAVENMLEGRRFTIRIPFGCGNPGIDSGRGYGASYDAESRTLRVSVQPEDWSTLPWVSAELRRREAEGADGFRVPRPWTQSESCPIAPSPIAPSAAASSPAAPNPAAPNPAAPSPAAESAATQGPATQSPTAQSPTFQSDPASSLGITQVYDADSSRVGQRRGRPLEATIQLDADQPDLSKGLHLVLEGRVTGWPASRDTVLCRAERPLQRPLCLISAKFDLIAVENASNGEQLADWRF